jgi:hypothetical protein
MSVNNSNQINSSNYRTSFLQPKKKYSSKNKPSHYSKRKYYLEEYETNPSKKFSTEAKDKDSPESEIVYEDEYQGLIYHPKNQNQNWDNSYYYIEKDKTEEYNNFKTKWKTEICHYWEMYGECKFGDNCAFAHGDSELKKRKMTFNYKTKPCKQFFELGYCSYGARCQFSHKKEDLKKEKNINEDEKNDGVSYLKIIKEFLSDDSQISLELVKRPRLMTFEKITSSTLEESKNSKLQLYEDIMNIKNSNSKENNNNLKFKHSEDYSNYTNVSSDNNNDNNDKE